MNKKNFSGISLTKKCSITVYFFVHNSAQKINKKQNDLQKNILIIRSEIKSDQKFRKKW